MSNEALVFQTTPIITISYVIQVLFSLLVIVAFIYLAAKYFLPKLKITSTNKFIKVLDRVFLEPQVTAYILKAGKSAWLIVVSAKNIARIDKLEDFNDA